MFIHPKTRLTANVAIEYLPLPEKRYNSCIAAYRCSCNNNCNKGDKVKTGQVIAASQGFVSSNIHSSVSGTVNKIDFVIDSSGYKQIAVFIDVEGDEWVETIDRRKEISYRNKTFTRKR